MAEDTITHFSHPGHELVKRHYTGPFGCVMCWERLSGAAYGCRAGCDFAIHDACAGHPQTLTSPSHHPHQLVLVETRRDVTHGCDVCAGRCAAGCFLYRCPPCGFDMHPRCAKLPPAVRSVRHPEHDLALVVAEGRCAACHAMHGAGARAWLYRCNVCNLDLHVSCAAAEGPEDAENGHFPGAGDDGLGLDIRGELLRSRIAAQSHMATAVAMRNAGWSLANLI
ncbi:hypothetical protein SETIT_2G388000v2 [Setaria italica]|nr:hypothetical protein SETIT_2G388000v2 [Setaria italica]